MSINTKFGHQLLGRPPESYRAKCGGGKGIKVVGDEADLTQLRDWQGKVEILQGRLITAEDEIKKARERNDLSEIPKLAKNTARLYAGVNARIGVSGVWWEIPYIMPEVSPWTAKWYAAAAIEFHEMDLRSVAFGFATGTPQVAPWAATGGHGADEWPQLYDCLAVLHALGTDWVRIGVEEYITGGYLPSGDWSNVGRIVEVYNRHIQPNGWNIVFRGIEAGYDLPGMHDASITPHNLLTGNIRPGDLAGGLEQADMRYSLLPFVDCMFLYQVSDPTVQTEEAAFAFTPGDKNTPIGYLERMQMYWAENPPKPFVAPKPGGGTTTPPKPDPKPEPQPTPIELVVNGDFTGGTYAVSGNPDQQVVPAGWHMLNPKDRVEIERDPRFPVSVRIIQAYTRREVAIRPIVPIAVEVGATYRITVRLAGWCTDDASSPFSASTSPATMRVKVEDKVVSTLPVQPGDLPTIFPVLIADVKATMALWLPMISIQPDYAVQRTDLRIDSVSIVKIKDAVAPPKGDRQVLVISEVNQRAEPKKASAWLGTFRPGAKLTVTGDVVNGYIQEKFYGVWLLAANLQGV